MPLSQVSNNKMYFRIINIACMIGLLVVLSACVTTTEVNSGYAPNKKPLAERVDTQIEIGVRYLELGEYELALQSLNNAQSLQSNNPVIHEALAMVFQKTQEPVLAQKHFEKALRLKPKYTKARNNYAVFLFEQKRYVESCRELSIVVKDVYYDRRSDAFTNLGLCASKTNNNAIAKQAFEKALVLNPRQALSLLELTKIYFNESNFSAAQTKLKQFHEVVPKGSPESLLLGYRIARLFNQTIEAQTYKRALKKLYPQSPQALQLR